jgi:hypothetical protein
MSDTSSNSVTIVVTVDGLHKPVSMSLFMTAEQAVGYVRDELAKGSFVLQVDGKPVVVPSARISKIDMGGL